MNKYFKRGVYVVLMLSLFVSGMVGVLRIKAESKYKDLQIAIRYIDVIDVARQEDRPIEEILQSLKDKGATTILVRENTLLPGMLGDLANWKAQGKLTAYEGYELIRMYPQIQGIAEAIQPQLSYVAVNDQGIYEDILSEITVKNLGGKQITLENKVYIEYRGHASTLSTMGMGFPLEDLTLAAQMGYMISPQVKAWPGETPESVTHFINMIGGIPNLGVVYFADAEVTGAKDPQMEEFAKDHQIGFIEFFSAKQKGLFSLAKKGSEQGTSYQVARLHTVSDGEATKLKTSEIVSRYWLAATERNQQVFLFKMPTTLDIKEDFFALETQIGEFAEKATSNGFNISPTVGNYNLPMGSFVLAFLSGLAPIAIFVLLFDLVKQRKIGILLGIIGLIGYGGILKLRPTLGLQLMALFGASVFPTYGVLWALEKTTKDIKDTILLFLQTCTISFGGALTVVGLLSRTNFGLTMDLFLGVKLAHLIPIVLVVMVHIYNKYGFSVNFVKNILTSKVTYLALAAMAVIGAVLLFYTSRTGNSGSVSSLELAFRAALDRILGVRPRTKEFMIGYPLLIAVYYYGCKEWCIPILAIAVIGPISLVNTYAHVHTPLMISLIRSGYGIVFGLIGGLILIYIINQVLKVAEKWNLKSE